MAASTHHVPTPDSDELRIASVGSSEAPRPASIPKSRHANPKREPGCTAGRIDDLDLPLPPDTAPLHDGEVQRWRHKRRVSRVAFSPDGKRVASSGDDLRAYVWEIGETEPAHVVDAHLSPVFAVDFAPPDGARLLTAAYYCNCTWDMRLWSVADGERLADFEAQPGVITRVAFSPDGKLLLTGNVWHDTAVRLWDVETGEEIARLWNDRFPETVAFAPDGSWFAAGEAWGARGPYRVRRWDRSTAELLGQISFEHDVRALDIAPDSERLVIATGRVKPETYALGVYDANSGALTAACEGDVVGTKDAKFLADGATIAAVDGSGRLRLWDAATGKLVRSFPTIEGVSLDALAVSPKGDFLATGGSDGAVRLWKL